jgi:hypothetical protein
LNIRYTLTQIKNYLEDKHIKNRNFINGFLVVAVLLAIGLACSGHGTKLDYNGGELYYTANVTEADAKKLGDYLVKEQFFSGKKVTVQLDKSGATYQVRMVIIPEKQNDAAYHEILKAFAGQVSASVFNNAATEIHVCDDSLKTLKVISK